MPVRNGERFIRRALVSTLRALPKDGELVVLDDGSTDRTAEILASVEDKRLVTHRREDSAGIAAGLNYLLDRTDSAFVARMDADDITLPWRFRRQLRMARSVDLVFSSVVFINDGGLPTRPDLPGRMSASATPLHLVTASCLCHPTMLARRSAVPREGYRSLAAEDYDLWLRMLADGRSVARDVVPALLYRQHKGQTSASTAWWNRRDDELQHSELLEAYRGALEYLGLRADAPAAALGFAMSTVPPVDAADRDWLLGLNRQISERVGGLPALDRLPLTARLRAARRRISAGGTP